MSLEIILKDEIWALIFPSLKFCRRFLLFTYPLIFVVCTVVFCNLSSFVCTCAYLNDLGIASGNTSDVLVTAMSINLVQNITAVKSMLDIASSHYWAILNTCTCKQNQQGYKKPL